MTTVVSLLSLAGAAIVLSLLVNLVLKFNRYRIHKKMESASEEDYSDGDASLGEGSTLEEVSRIDKETLEDLIPVGTVDRTKFAIHSAKEAAGYFDKLKKNELLEIAYDDIGIRGELRHSDRTREEAHNRAVPKFAEFANDKRFITNSGQVFHFAPEVIHPLSAAPVDLETRLAGLLDEAEKHSERDSLIQDVCQIVMNQVQHLIDCSVNKTIREVLAKELLNVLELAKKEAIVAAKAEVGDAAFLKKVEDKEKLEREAAPIPTAKKKPVKAKKKPVKRKF